MTRVRERGWPVQPEPLPRAVVDNHTHLESVLEWNADGWSSSEPTYLPGLEDHLDRASAVGVDRLVQVGCDLDSARWTDQLLHTATPVAGVGLLGALAIHPNEAVLHAGVREVAADGLEPDPLPRHGTSLDEAIAVIADLARSNPRVRAIGESGLDYFRGGDQGRAVQREAFRAHIALAKELGLALQIHDRDAHQDVVDILLADGAPERTVFHCFSGDVALAQVCAANGWYLSVAGPVTFRANDTGREAVRSVPLHLLLAETDAPYLTPHPYRGRPNSPYLLGHTVREIARVRDAPLDVVCDAISAASERIYGPW